MGFRLFGVSMMVGMEVNEVQVLSKGLKAAVGGINVFIGI
jgi:hypothetical protein